MSPSNRPQSAGPARRARPLTSVAGPGIAIALLVGAAVLPDAPAHAATPLPTTASIATSWTDRSQTTAVVEMRSGRSQSAGGGWFKLKSAGDATFDCGTVRGRDYGRSAEGRLVATRSLPVSQLYCDGIVVTGKITGIRAGTVAALTATSDPLAGKGPRSLSGTAQVGSHKQAAKRTLTKSAADEAATVRFPSRVNTAHSGGLGATPAWSAEFKNGARDLRSWHVSDNTTYGAGGGSTNVMRADPENVRVEADRLKIQSHRVTPSRATQGQPFSSGYLTSDYVLDLSKPGRLDAKLRPNLTAGKSKGKWPGLWLRNRGHQELDITEMIGTSAKTSLRSNQFRVTAHADTMSRDPRHRGQTHSFVGSPNQFHLWRTEWDGKGNITISCDGTVAAKFRVKTDPWLKDFTGDFQIRLDQFVQGSMAGPVDKATTFDNAFEIGFLRYYR